MTLESTRCVVYQRERVLSRAKKLSKQALFTVLYVNKIATGTGDGSSWANAFTDLQQALKFCSDTIRVAAGSYLPSNNNKESSFWLQNKSFLYPDGLILTLIIKKILIIFKSRDQ